MKRLTGLIALVLFGGIVAAQARPPTVDISPGYDRRLQESRRALGAGQPDIVAPAPRVVPRERHRHRHDRRY